MFLAGQLIERVGQMNTYLILGGLSVCIALVCEIALIRSTPEELGQKPLGWNETRDESVERISADHDAESGLTAAEARRSKEFIMLLIAVFMSAMLMATFYDLCDYILDVRGIVSIHSGYDGKHYYFVGWMCFDRGRSHCR